jgi:hypothetical protein
MCDPKVMKLRFVRARDRIEELAAKLIREGRAGTEGQLLIEAQDVRR